MADYPCNVNDGASFDALMTKLNNLTVIDSLTNTSTTNPLSANQGKILKGLIDGIKLAIYPIGSIYISTVNTNPSTFLGGTWVSWGSGKVPVGVDIAQTEFNTVEKTGGEKTHTLTTNELPNSALFLGGAGDGLTTTNKTYPVASGGGQSHNNLPPYITCYMWKRMA